MALRLLPRGGDEGAALRQSLRTAHTALQVGRLAGNPAYAYQGMVVVPLASESDIDAGRSSGYVYDAGARVVRGIGGDEPIVIAKADDPHFNLGQTVNDSLALAQRFRTPRFSALVPYVEAYMYVSGSGSSDLRVEICTKSSDGMPGDAVASTIYPYPSDPSLQWRRIEFAEPVALEPDTDYFLVFSLASPAQGTSYILRQDSKHSYTDGHAYVLYYPFGQWYTMNLDLAFRIYSLPPGEVVFSTEAGAVPDRVWLMALVEGAAGYQVSRDGGITWTDAVPESWVDLSRQPEGNELLVKVQLGIGSELRGFAFGWQ